MKHLRLQYSREKLYNLKIIGKFDYARVFQLILYLRLLCDHPLLIKSSQASAEMAGTVEIKDLLLNYYGDSNSDFASNLVSELEKVDTKECPVCTTLTNLKVCFEDCLNGILLPACLHILCQVCVQDILEKNQEKGLSAECPVCRKEFTEAQILLIIKNDLEMGKSEDESSYQKSKINLKSMHFKPSSKLAALMENISFMFSQDTQTKCVCFSQWTSMLDIVETELNMHGLAFVRLDGTMSQSKRDQSIKKFKSDPKVRILIASLRATGEIV